jgi:lipopolysaccharide export system protein LptC
LASYRNNQLVAVGRAQRLAYERSSSNADVEMPLIRLPSRSRLGGQFAELGGVEIRAPRAEGNLASQKLEAFGGVLLRTGSGVTARTERALYDGQALVTSGEGAVEVRGPVYALNAVGFTLRSRDEDFTFGGPLQSGLGKVR